MLCSLISLTTFKGPVKCQGSTRIIVKQEGQGNVAHCTVNSWQGMLNALLLPPVDEGSQAIFFCVIPSFPYIFHTCEPKLLVLNKRPCGLCIDLANHLILRAYDSGSCVKNHFLDVRK